MILSLEATDRGGSIALGSKEGELLEVVYENSSVTHSERLMPTIDRLLTKREFKYEDIDTIAVAKGPGSFTAIRLAVTTAKTLALACDANLYADSTLRVMAEYGHGRDDRITAMIDARRNEIYRQEFQVNGDRIEAATEPKLDDPDSVNPNGIVVFRSRDLEWADLPSSGSVVRIDEPLARPLAIPLLNLAQSGAPEENPDHVSPCYIRKSDAQRNTNGQDPQ